jgi:cysteine desulfurase
MIYFDTAASYPLLPEVRTVLDHAFGSLYGNSSSSHLLGEEAANAVAGIRKQLADEIGAYSSEIIFTSGATESNNIALKSLLLGSEVKTKKHIVTTQIEHKCIFSICHYLESLGFGVTYVKPDKEGMISAASIEEAITTETALVSVMHVNNELGTVNPIGEIGELCRNNEILFHSDAAQSFMKIPVDVDELNVDVMSFSAHKIGGPKGIGAVYIRDLRSRELTPVIHGAGQEDGVRGGTVASPLILGFGSAVENFPRYYNQFKQVKARELLCDELKKHNVKYKVNGSGSSLSSCLSLSLPTINVAQLIRENERVFCLAQGSACSSNEIEASHVLAAIGLSRQDAERTLRISFSLDVTKEDITDLVSAIRLY